MPDDTIVEETTVDDIQLNSESESVISDGTLQVNCPSFLDNILQGDVCDTILDLCSPASFLRLERSCRVARAVLRDYRRRAFNINRHLGRFFAPDDVLAFRTLQANTGTLVSGSVALQFFDRSYYPGSDLDLYVHMPWRRHVGIWLLEHGYHFVHNRQQPSSFAAAVRDPHTVLADGIYTMPGVAAIFDFVKPSPSGTGEDLKIQLIIAAHSPMEVILQFHSTCVMNVISYDKAYALYPRATFEERQSLVFQKDQPRRKPAISKYAARGWRMIEHIPASRRNIPNNPFPTGSRWVADSDSWIIPLPTDGVGKPLPLSSQSIPLTQDPMILTTWNLCIYDWWQGISVVLFRDDLLYYEYMLEDMLMREILKAILYERRRDQMDRTSCFDESILIVGTALLREQQIMRMHR